MDTAHKVIHFCDISDKSFDLNNNEIAKQIKQKMNISKGKCLEISSDVGRLGIAVAEITDLDVYLYDTSELSIEIARKRINNRRLGKKVFILPFDSLHIPVDNESMDYIVGIKSIWFISNYVRSLNEIYRVLAPNGTAYIRVGNPLRNIKNSYGNVGQRICPVIYNEVTTETNKLINQLIQAVSKADIKNFEILDERFGVWILINKESVS